MQRSALLSLLALLVLTACTRDAPTEPRVDEEVAASAAVVPLDGAATMDATAAGVDLEHALADVTARLLPGLHDQTAAEQLDHRLKALTAHLQSDAAAARVALAEAEAALQQLVAQDASSSDRADLSFIQLTLDQARLVLDGPDTVEGISAQPISQKQSTRR